MQSAEHQMSNNELSFFCLIFHTGEEGVDWTLKIIKNMHTSINNENREQW